MNVIESALAQHRDSLDANETGQFVEAEIRRLFHVSVEKSFDRVEQGEFESHPAVAQMALLTGAKLPRMLTG